MSGDISNDELESHQNTAPNAFRRFNIESDDGDSIASYSSDSRPTYSACPTHMSQTTLESVDRSNSGSDAGLDDAGESSEGSLDFMQSPRGEAHEETYVSNRVWNLLMSSSSPLPPDESILLPRLLSGSDSDSEHSNGRESEDEDGYIQYSEDPVSPNAGGVGFLSPQREALDSVEIHRISFRAADLFASNADRARRLLGGLETVSQEWLNDYKATQGGSEDSIICAICLQSLLDREPSIDVQSVVNSLPCRHIFHMDCLAPWFATKTTCPTCRLNLDPDHVTTLAMNTSLQDGTSNFLRLLEHGRWSTVPSGSPISHLGLESDSDGGSEDWDDIPDMEPTTLGGLHSPVPAHTSPVPLIMQTSRSLLTPINSRAQTMDLPSEQLPFDQIRWPPGRSTSIETGSPAHIVQDANQRVSAEVLRTWLLRRSLETAMTGSPQVHTSADLRGHISPSGSIESSPPFQSLTESVDVAPRVPTPDVEWSYAFPYHRHHSPQHSPHSNRAILELPSEYYPLRYSPLMTQSSGSISSFPFASPLIDPSMTGSSDGSEHRPFDFSVYDTASQQSPISAPLSIHSSPRPTVQTLPTSYTALSQAMHRMRGQANRDARSSHHVSDTFTFGEPSTNREADSNHLPTEGVKWTLSPNVHSWVEEPEPEPSGSSGQNLHGAAEP